MKNEDFEELLLSARQAGQIRAGKLAPSRKFEFAPQDIRETRRKLGVSQSQFALLIGVSVSTLQNWEQGRRRPDGPARALLKIADTNPKALLEALSA